jgi:hypothetical protein
MSHRPARAADIRLRSDRVQQCVDQFEDQMASMYEAYISWSARLGATGLDSWRVIPAELDTLVGELYTIKVVDIFGLSPSTGALYLFLIICSCTSCWYLGHSHRHVNFRSLCLFGFCLLLLLTPLFCHLSGNDINMLISAMSEGADQSAETSIMWCLMIRWVIVWRHIIPHHSIVFYLLRLISTNPHTISFCLCFIWVRTFSKSVYKPLDYDVISQFKSLVVFNTTGAFTPNCLKPFSA